MWECRMLASYISGTYTGHKASDDITKAQNDDFSLGIIKKGKQNTKQ